MIDDSSFKPTNTNNKLTFDELYSEIKHDWRGKAQRLQERRWRAIHDDNL